MKLIEFEKVISLWDKYHYSIATHAMEFDEELRELPTVDAVPMSWITDYEAKIVQNLVEIVQSKDFDDDEFHMQTCMLMAVAEMQTAWAERKEE